MENILKKGRGHRAEIGEIRIHANGKYKKTAPGSNGWTLLKDVHRAKSDGHEAHVHTVTPEKVYFHVHDKEGNKVANGKLKHEDFRENYTPVLINHPTIGSDSHVQTYFSNTQNEVPIEPIEEEEEVPENIRTFTNDDDLDEVIDEEILDDDLPEIIVDDPDEDELEDEAISPYKLNLQTDTMGRVTGYTVGSLVQFLTDGRRKEGRIEDIADNGILTINTGNINHYISPMRLVG
jgi:hypothetical protein